MPWLRPPDRRRACPCSIILVEPCGSFSSLVLHKMGHTVKLLGGPWPGTFGRDSGGSTREYISGVEAQNDCLLVPPEYSQNYPGPGPPRAYIPICESRIGKIPIYIGDRAEGGVKALPSERLQGRSLPNGPRSPPWLFLAPPGSSSVLLIKSA